MKKTLLNIGLYISSFIPLYLLVILKTLIEIVNGNMSINITNTTLLLIMICLVIIGSIAVNRAITKYYELTEITILDFKNTTDQHFLGYFSLFVLFALTFDLSKVSMTVIYIIILILIGRVYIKNHLYNINPFLNIMGYCCYFVTYKDIQGNEHSAQIYYKGRLNLARYKVSLINDGICFVKSQIIK